MKPTFLYLLLAFFGLTSFRLEPKIANDFKRFYDQYKVEGSFVLYDQKNDKYIVYNESQISTPFTPASTFKICNSLIALETRVIKDENEIFEWDKIERQIPSWNSNTDMRAAFKNSTVWYYQEVAKRINPERMKTWLNRLPYGNSDTTGGINGFWLWGGLRITPKQQIDFLRKLHDNKLPFAQRNMDIVKDIMVAKDTLGYVVRAKTGLGKQDKQYIGWYVGYITTNDNVFYFANCIQSKENMPSFSKARIDIAYKILDDLKVTRQ